MVQDKHQVTIMGSKKLTYALSVEIMTLTLNVTVTKKHENVKISLKQG